jgi:flagellar hook assembly protein FlgD
MFPKNKDLLALVPQIENRANQSNFSKINIARLNDASGKHAQALALYQSAKGNDVTKPEYKLAGLNEFYDNVLNGDISTAESNLASLTKSLGKDKEVTEASWILQVMKGSSNKGNEGDKKQLASGQLESGFRLANYPNPFNPSTSIRFVLPQQSQTSLVVYDMLGREVRTLANNTMNAGNYQVEWDGRNNAGLQVAAGVYVYRIQSGSLVAVQKMLLMK